MDYKEKYEQALERAKEYKEKGYMMINAALDNIFPELLESEDEKIRKELIDAIQGLWDNDALPMPLSVKRKDTWLTWLEKQGEKQPIWTDNDRIMAFTLLRDVDQMTTIDKEGKNERLEWLNSLDDRFNKE